MRNPTYLRTVVDDRDPCPYIAGQTARMPLECPVSQVTPERLDELLELGYRRTGWFFYRTRCPACDACKPLRILISSFLPNRSQRRAVRKAEGLLDVRIQPAKVDQQRVRLFNLHRRKRNLSHGSSECDYSDYESFLTNSACDVREIGLWQGERLVGASITDVGRESLSAVYCFFDPEFSHLSPGTFAIMQQVALAERESKKWLYLGMYVAENRHLNYKARFTPHQRLIDGQWVDFGLRGSRAEKG